jgi:hypothetical protein
MQTKGLVIVNRGRQGKTTAVGIARGAVMDGRIQFFKG